MVWLAYGSEDEADNLVSLSVLFNQLLFFYLSFEFKTDNPSGFLSSSTIVQLTN